MSLRDRLMQDDLIADQNPYYSTYVMGRFSAMFDTPECSTNHWCGYQSNWRVLHIDGFETGYGSRTIQFCWSTGAHSGRFADKMPSENVGGV